MTETITSLFDQHKAELKPILARHRKEIRELQKRCPHDGEIEHPFPNPSFVRCLKCHKVWEILK